MIKRSLISNFCCFKNKLYFGSELFIFAALKKSIFKNKSEINIAAAELLHDEGHYPAVAHSAYYGCFQYMMHIWINSMGKTPDDLDTICNSTKSKTHTALLNEIVKFIRANDLNDSRKITNSIGSLKKIRVDSDYKEKEILYPTSKSALDESIKTLTILKKY